MLRTGTGASTCLWAGIRVRSMRLFAATPHCVELKDKQNSCKRNNNRKRQWIVFVFLVNWKSKATAMFMSDSLSAQGCNAVRRESFKFDRVCRGFLMWYNINIIFYYADKRLFFLHNIYINSWLSRSISFSLLPSLFLIVLYLFSSCFHTLSLFVFITSLSCTFSLYLLFLYPFSIISLSFLLNFFLLPLCSFNLSSNLQQNRLFKD